MNGTKTLTQSHEGHGGTSESKEGPTELLVRVRSEAFQRTNTRLRNEFMDDAAVVIHAFFEIRYAGGELELARDRFAEVVRSVEAYPRDGRGEISAALNTLDRHVAACAKAVDDARATLGILRT